MLPTLRVIAIYLTVFFGIPLLVGYVLYLAGIPIEGSRYLDDDEPQCAQTYRGQCP